MISYENIYLATNLDALDVLAKPPNALTNLSKFEIICNALNKLFKTSQENPLDQEKTYILLKRYLYLHEKLLKSQSDKSFVEIRFGSEFRKVKALLEQIRSSLEVRYSELIKTTDVLLPVEILPVVLEEKTKRIFNSNFITCSQLYSALQEENNNILLVDARPTYEFENSRLLVPNCINISEDCITAGLSANALGKRLSEETQKIWDKRSSFSVIVLFDWNTTRENFAFSKLQQLYSALVDWDLNRTYPEPPVVLQGGYEAMGQTYPTMCNNLRAYISKKYQDFEELLDLDTIVYPQEPECDQALIGCNEQNLLYRKWCNFIEKLEKADDFCKELTSAYQTLLSGANSLEENSGKLTLEELKAKRAALTNLMNEIGAKLKNVYEKRDKLKTEADTCKSLISMERVTIKDSLGKRKMVKEDLEEPIVGDGNEMVVHQPDDGGDNFLELEDTTTTAATSSLKTVEEDAAEPLRKKAVLRAKILSVKPTIDRSMKPFPVIGALEHRNEGLVGLKNIKNTCYMNAVIQCIRHCPSISEFFCSGTFSTHRVKLNCAILSQMASLVRYMWTTCEKYVTPTSFYKRVTSLDPIFGQGLHEDATEFLLFLLNHLTEDCIYEADQHSTLTTTQKAWELHFQGKHSFFIDTFHHQIRNKQMCLKCMKPSYRFDTEPSVMVHTPTHDTDLLTLLDEYLADFIIPGKCCLICKGPMINKKDVTVTPEVLIIIVKRTIPPMRGSGHQAFAKSNHMVRFPRENLPFGKSKYKLISITLHSGDADFGHYRAYCLTQKGWAIFNDENSEIVTSENDSIAREAYIYFYTKM